MKESNAGAGSCPCPGLQGRYRRRASAQEQGRYRWHRLAGRPEREECTSANNGSQPTRMGYRQHRLLGDLQRMLQRTPEAYYMQRRQRPEYADLVGLTRQYLTGRRRFDSTARPVELAQTHYW